MDGPGSGLNLLWMALACRDEADDWRCMGPLTELVRWRDELEQDRIFRGRYVTPAHLAKLERHHVEQAVETLRPRQNDCDNAWRMVMWATADNPGSRLREEAVRRLLSLPPRQFDAETLGHAGRPVDLPRE